MTESENELKELREQVRVLRKQVANVRGLCDAWSLNVPGNLIALGVYGYVVKTLRAALEHTEADAND